MSQTTLIVGTNGSGKSTLLDALCFVLFNKPFRIIKKEQMINTINQSDCLVEVEFDVGTKNYIVRRGIKPNLFEIFCDGKLINQDANNIDYQKYLEQNIMKLNYRSFILFLLFSSSLFCCTFWLSLPLVSSVFKYFASVSYLVFINSAWCLTSVRFF